MGTKGVPRSCVAAKSLKPFDILPLPKNASGVLELTAQSRQISEYTFKTFEAFTAATLIYIVITLTVTFFMRAIERRVAVPGFIAQAGGGH